MTMIAFVLIYKYPLGARGEREGSRKKGRSEENMRPLAPSYFNKNILFLLSPCHSLYHLLPMSGTGSIESTISGVLLGNEMRQGYHKFIF